MERAFIYGDLIFETMLWKNGSLMYEEEHLERLNAGLELLGMKAHVGKDFLQTLIMEKIEERTDARIRLVASRKGTGFYLPYSNGVSFELEIFNLPVKKKEIESACIYMENYKPCTPLSNIKSGNALIYVLASLYANKQGFDDAIILNEHGKVCEATSSNIFIKSNQQFITPPLSEGCVDGVMRKVWMRELKSNGLEVIEQPLTIADIQSADQIWLTNVINGPIKLNKILV